MYSSSYPSDAASGGAIAALLAFMGVIWLIALVLAVLAIAGLWKAFVKAGQPGWAAIIPIYNMYVLLQIVGRPTWWLAFMLLPFIPFVGGLALLVVEIIILNDLSKSFGQSTGFTVGLVLVGFVFLPILGFGQRSTSARWRPASAIQPLLLAAPGWRYTAAAINRQPSRTHLQPRPRLHQPTPRRPHPRLRPLPHHRRLRHRRASLPQVLQRLPHPRRLRCSPFQPSAFKKCRRGHPRRRFSSVRGSQSQPAR